MRRLSNLAAAGAIALASCSTPEQGPKKELSPLEGSSPHQQVAGEIRALRDSCRTAWQQVAPTGNGATLAYRRFRDELNARRARLENLGITLLAGADCNVLMGVFSLKHQDTSTDYYTPKDSYLITPYGDHLQAPSDTGISISQRDYSVEKYAEGYRGIY